MTSKPVSRGAAARRIISTLLVIGVTFGVVACTDDEGSAPPTTASDDAIDQIKDVTFAAGSARFSGEQRFADGATGPIEGISQAAPSAGETTYPISTETGVQEAAIVWVDSDLYTRRVVTSDPSSVSTSHRMADELPWFRMTYQPLLPVSFVVYDPFRLLERLQIMGVDAVPSGTESIDGDELDRYVVDLAATPIMAGGPQSVELLTNDDQRLEVVRVIADTRIEYALDDFGTDVAPTRPPEDQIGEPRQAPGPQPEGPFELVGQGTSAGVSWQLYRAPASDGDSCWRLDTDQPLDPVAASPDGATCTSSVDAGESDADQVEVVVDAGRAASFDAVVAVTGPPGATSARLVFADRSSEDLAVDPAGFVVWIGPKTPLAAVLEVTTADGTVATCGPGSITEVADLERIGPAEQGELDRTPWLCIAL